MDAINGFRSPPKFKSAALKPVAPSPEWLGNYSFGFGLPPYYLGSWRIIIKKLLTQMSEGTSQTWCSARRPSWRESHDLTTSAAYSWSASGSDDCLCDALLLYFSFGTEPFTELPWVEYVLRKLTWSRTHPETFSWGVQSYRRHSSLYELHRVHSAFF